MTATLETKQPTAATPAISPTTSKLPAAVLGLTRIVFGFLFTCHGVANLFGVIGGADGNGATIPALTWPTGWASMIEMVAGALLVVGLATRPVAVLCSGVMAFAYFTVHAPTGLFPIQNHGELAAMNSWVFLLIAVLGSGSFALDGLRRR